MGVRLVKHGVDSGGEGTCDHNLLFNRDMDDQHPISAITGLQEALDKLEFDTKDSTSLHLNFDSSVKELTGNVIISSDDDNALEIRPNGLYCGGSGGGIKNVLKVTQKDHGFKVGEVLYCKNDGTFAKALAENTEKVEAVGVVSEIRTKDVFILTLAGLLQTNIFNSYPNGCVLYLDESTPGKLIDFVDLIYKPIAIKIKEGILINIQRGDTYGSYTGGTIPLDFEYYSTDEILAILNEIWT